MCLDEIEKEEELSEHPVAGRPCSKWLTPGLRKSIRLQVAHCLEERTLLNYVLLRKSMIILADIMQLLSVFHILLY